MTRPGPGVPAPRFTRRTAVAGIATALLGVAGCTRAEPERATPTVETPPPVEPPPVPPAPVVPALPVPVGWDPAPADVEPSCKLAAVAAVSAALTRPNGGLPAELAPLAGVLPGSGPSVLQTVYPQYGGLNPRRTRASVMLVAELFALSSDGSSVQRVGLTLDVRLRRGSSGWKVTEVLVPAAVGVASPVPAEASAVLQDPRIHLPAAARWDLAAGGIDGRVSSLLSALSARWTVQVQVLRSGHPYDVFETGRTSNHTLGRAVDVRAVDGVPVVDHGNCPWRDVLLAAADLGADELGGPDRPAPRRPYFTDAVHQDHLHLGFEA